MANRIFKYQFPTGTTEKIFQIPDVLNAKFLSAQIQNNRLSIWVQVNDRYGARPVKIHVYGTEHIIPEGLNYIDTILTHNDKLVLHVFWGKV